MFAVIIITYALINYFNKQNSKTFQEQKLQLETYKAELESEVSHINFKVLSNQFCTRNLPHLQEHVTH